MHQNARSYAKAKVLGVFTGLGVSLLALGPMVGAQSSGGAASPSGSAGGVIMYERQVQPDTPGTTYTVAPDGTGQRTILADYDCCPVLSLDGQRVMVSVLAADGKRYTTGILNADGTGYTVMKLPNATVNLDGITWGPDGVGGFAGWDDADPSHDGIYIGDPTDPASIRQVTTTPAGGNAYPQLFSPDGSRVAYVRGDTPSAANGTLLVVDVDGQHEVQLNPSGSEVSGEADWGWHVSWSPDGLRLAFTNVTHYGFGTTVFVADADGSDLTTVYQADDGVSQVSWSPDGQRILLNTDVGGQVQVVLVHPDGTDPTTITNLGDGKESWGAKWSPDGSRVLFQHGIIGNNDADLWTMNADGTDPAQLTHDPGRYQWYAWGL